MDEAEFSAAVAALGVTPTAAQLAKFARYYQDLVAANEHVNLTAITEQSAVYLKHFYDSLTLLEAVPALKSEPLTLCDVGAGAGFPSLPVKIMAPQLDVTIVDSLNKRIAFLDGLVQALGLSGVHLYHDRAETFGGKRSAHREAYDVVVARAVAPLNVLAELCLPLVRPGGQFVALKGSKGEEEISHAKTAFGELGGQLKQVQTLSLPETGDPRTLIVVDKISKTPGRFPRKPGTPSKQPLGG
ncbi:16S rRNA (guanine(527)-N(7))-methyltransferase RsmG [Lacticaseibacillus camelliae]|uniref:Ribosomal RNA small subunit methyltransferase G n=2 Tax=Lacticaseibacillus camelliae TaxID=381742 RepID=A0A0R2FMY3_9LACO|nr:16S rRNA (guanine(527)-N(7))-methyltransferase RsmG [Lacticaseibacillus camelliae]KRN25853.1 methyltransferase, cell division protein gidb [Lacticaseibacillus camelliae DSM 22697 = JCM 13995]